MERYLGVEVEKASDGNSFSMTQPHLIQRCIDLVGVDESVTKGRANPVVKPLLSKDLDGPERKCKWKYRTATGMLGYLQHSTRPDISMATHQCAKFNNDPRLSHERAIKRIVRYLLDTKDKGIIFKPDLSRGLECFVDAEFAGGWKDCDHSTAESVLSRTGFVIMFAGCPLTWCSKLQTEIALSTTEAEYIALSQAMREVIPFLNLLKEIGAYFPLNADTPLFHCKVWEDNMSCIKVATSPKFTPRTKHIALKYHHFRSFVDKKVISIFPTESENQTADIFTKPIQGDKQFAFLRHKLMGW